MAPQSYYLGGKIRAIDYNGFADDINEIVGIGAGDSGYGQSQLVIPNIASGVKVNATHMQLLLTALKYAGRHQGTSILSPDDVNDLGFPSVGKLIELIPNLISDITNVRSNKLNYDIGMMDYAINIASSSKTYVEPTATGDVWGGSSSNPTYEVSAIFADEDSRRHFFNTGGEIRLTTDFTATYNDSQSLDWEALFNAVGMIKFSHNITEVTGSTGTPGGGFTGLTSSYTTVYEKGGGDGGYQSYYGNNKYQIQARLNGTNAIDFKVELYDTHVADTGFWGGIPWTGQDYVAGQLTSSIDIQYANDTHSSGLGVVVDPSGPGPTFVAISNF